MTEQSPTTLCTFYVVRHGETEWNTQRRLQGFSDSPLTENGLLQAKEKAELFHDIEFAEVISSDLLRAKRTAEILAQEHKLLVKSTELIRERNFGKYEGQHVQVLKDDLKKMVAHLTETEKRKFKLSEEMESDDEVISRLLTFLRQTALAFPGKNVLIVTHSGVLRMLLLHLGFVTETGLDGLTIKNLAHIKLDCDGTEFFIRETHNIFKH